MTYKTKSGKILTEPMIEEMGMAVERGEYPGMWGKLIVAPVGRPPISPDDELVTVAFKLPRSFRDKLDATAKKNNETRSAYLREVLVEVLGQ